MPVVASVEQLDEAELGVRLVLNQLHADTGEQIEVTRDALGIQVKGLVETEQRKRELQDRLHALAYVTAMLSSLEQMKDGATQPSEITSVKVSSMQAQATPLETYYLEHGRSVGSLSKLSQQLFNSAFTVELESKAIEDLERRFTGRDGMTLLASATFSDLMFTHKHNLLAALRSEEELLAETGIPTASLETSLPTSDEPLCLTSAAERNLGLAKELALGDGERQRSAEPITAELLASIKDLYRGVRHAASLPTSSFSLNERKK
jgi:hypothetical protein